MSDEQLINFSSPCFGVKIVYNYGHRGAESRQEQTLEQAGQELMEKPSKQEQRKAGEYKQREGRKKR